MKIEIVHIGDELLTGEIDPYPEELIKMTRGGGASINMVSVVRDDYSDIMRLMDSAHDSGVGVLIITGGLGPTIDDITREVVADFLGLELEVSEEAVRWFVESVKRIYDLEPEMNEENYRMTKIPSGSEPLKNITGAACGIRAVKGDMQIFCLPGFPDEMLPMFKEYVLPVMEKEDVHEKEIMAYLPESDLEPLFQRVIEKYEVRIASLPSKQWVSKGNRVIFRGEEDEVEGGSAYFKQLLDGAKTRFKKE